MSTQLKQLRRRRQPTLASAIQRRDLPTRIHEEPLIQGLIASFDYWRLGFTNGAATIVTETGSLTNIVYANALIEAAVRVAANDARFPDIQKGPWHTGDFDSSWFARAGIPAMTLSARDGLVLAVEQARRDGLVITRAHRVAAALEVQRQLDRDLVAPSRVPAFEALADPLTAAPAGGRQQCAGRGFPDGRHG
jgi:hypothetical protein